MYMKRGGCACVHEWGRMCVLMKGGECVFVHEEERVCVCS